MVIAMKIAGFAMEPLIVLLALMNCIVIPSSVTMDFNVVLNAFLNEKVCNGEYDCLDGSDEMNSSCEQMIEYSSVCYQIRNGSGHLSSQVTSPNDVNSTPIHLNRETHWSKSLFLISVQSNHQIWLSFNKFHTPEYHTLKVYDGLYSNSPLILSHSGATRPPSIRSSSNHLYLEIPSFYHQSYGVEVFYTSMASTKKPFIPGCGGYVYGDGVISFPNFLLLTAEITECVWFVEAGQSNRATTLKKSSLLSNGTKLTSNAAASQMDLHSVMIVSDGWNSSGEVLYDSRIASGLQARTVTYSISHKTTIRFLRPENQTNNKDHDNWNLSLNVSTMHIPEYAVVNMTAGSSGTIKSPYFPVLPYEGNSDFRWNIHADSNSTIRLLFAFFDTQEGSDYIYVYDGPTVNSSLILEKTGTVSSPFTVHSSTNEVLVRFVSDDDFTLHSGFLALYSPV
ncbi:LOW QUALITY PROTEIN: deleted in malignant brain tumors 1 protein [Daphnia magna]|uniref:LOW QUALITY PROTEIN: deleted in malignant brain tumors 1 protein n=1 Tax=Daphnia magna TaxID=35525 RepID=UPI001E1BD963|nr:LOW QUALITY PROTEIN: deleted in malignant brain tumors 1 protein [Daphnia magna]